MKQGYLESSLNPTFVRLWDDTVEAQEVAQCTTTKPTHEFGPRRLRISMELSIELMERRE